MSRPRKPPLPESETNVKAILGVSKAASQERYKLFANAYIANGRNGTQAAISTGYSPRTASDQAKHLLRRPEVRAIIDKATERVLAKSGLTAERTLQELARVAYADIRSLYREDGSLKSPHEWDDDSAAAVAGMDVTEEFEGVGEARKLSGYTKKVRMVDKIAALDKAMKHLGLYERDNSQRAENLQLQVVLVGKTP